MLTVKRPKFIEKMETMEKIDRILLTIVAGLLILAIGVAIGDAYGYQRGYEKGFDKALPLTYATMYKK